MSRRLLTNEQRDRLARAVETYKPGLLPSDVRIAGPVSEQWQALWPAEELDRRVSEQAPEGWVEVERWESTHYPGCWWVSMRRPLQDAETC